MKVTEGVIPTLLGAAVTAAGIAVSKKNMKTMRVTKRNIAPLIEAGVIGYGLAHIVLGSIDIVQHK